MLSDGTSSGNAVSSTDQSTGPSVGRYDVLLAVVPVFLAAGVTLQAVADGPWITAGATASALAIGYALFGDPPRPPRGRSHPPEY